MASHHEISGDAFHFEDVILDGTSAFLGVLKLKSQLKNASLGLGGEQLIEDLPDFSRGLALNHMSEHRFGNGGE